MKKNRKFMKFSIICITCTFLFTLVANAASYTFKDLNVPRAQDYRTLLAIQKDMESNYGLVELTTLTSESVTFSARAVNASYGTGTLVTQTNMLFYVNYTNMYGTGQEMQARYRNHNWSLNTGKISGTFDYQ